MKTVLFSITLSLLSCSLFSQDLRILPGDGYFPFYHGVASGDPLSDRVMIWTRVSPDNAVEEIDVSWRMSLDTGMTNIVAEGVFTTSISRDYTVKIDVPGLDPNTFYYYDFVALDNYSKRGRTKTLPMGSPERIRMAVMSCSNYEHGYFNAYKHVSMRNDLDVCVHLGDYIYEYETGGFSANIDGRTNIPENEIITLEDYRMRHSHYKLDTDLQDAHQQHPWINVWDDHETANDAWRDGAQNHNSGEGEWSVRKANGIQAFYEWLPVREQESGQLYRDFMFGDLVHLSMLDTRLQRDEQVAATSAEINSPDRSILGDEQKIWVTEQIETSNAKWNVFGQQVMMAPITFFTLPVNPDQWDGYTADRAWFYDQVQNSDIENLVILTGDIHTAWGNDLPIEGYDNTFLNGSIGVEFVVTSVTSTAFDLGFGEGFVLANNDHVRYLDLVEHGYVVMEYTPGRVDGEWHFVDDVEVHQEGEFIGATYYALDGVPFLKPAVNSLEEIEFEAPFAPPYPIEGFVVSVDDPQSFILGVYPNPFEEHIQVQFANYHDSNYSLSIIGLDGKLHYEIDLGQPERGVGYIQMNDLDLAPGTYILRLSGNGHASSARIVAY